MVQVLGKLTHKCREGVDITQTCPFKVFVSPVMDLHQVLKDCLGFRLKVRPDVPVLHAHAIAAGNELIDRQMVIGKAHWIVRERGLLLGPLSKPSPRRVELEATP